MKNFSTILLLMLTIPRSHIAHLKNYPDFLVIELYWISILVISWKGKDKKWKPILNHDVWMRNQIEWGHKRRGRGWYESKGWDTGQPKPPSVHQVQQAKKSQVFYDTKLFKKVGCERQIRKESFSALYVIYHFHFFNEPFSSNSLFYEGLICAAINIIIQCMFGLVSLKLCSHLYFSISGASFERLFALRSTLWLEALPLPSVPRIFYLLATTHTHISQILLHHSFYL